MGKSVVKCPIKNGSNQAEPVNKNNYALISYLVCFHVKITIYSQLLDYFQRKNVPKTGKNLAPDKDTRTKVVLARN